MCYTFRVENAMMKLANEHLGITESAASAESGVYPFVVHFPSEQIGSTPTPRVAQFDTAGTVIRRQSVGFEPKIRVVPRVAICLVLMCWDGLFCFPKQNRTT